jgi:DNA ligase (NAD+)
MDSLMAATEEELTQTPGVGPKIAQSVVAFFRDPQNIRLIERLRSAGVRMEAEAGATAAPDLPLAGVSLCLTGTLDSMTRTQAADRVRALGGAVTDSLTRKSSYLVVGRDPGASKLRQAQRYGTPTIDEAAFLRLLEVGSSEDLPEGAVRRD